jgi:hypothetical protein
MIILYSRYPKKSSTKQAMFLILLIIAALLVGCQSSPVVLEEPPIVDPALIPEGMSVEEAATLISLEQVDDFPLYSMVYQADYSSPGIASGSLLGFYHQADWACSLFAVFGNQDEMLFGRNFDWDFSPGLLLFTDPADGYASVSMVDLYYLGFGEERAQGLTDLPLEDLENLLIAPFLPFDGLNEAGLAVGFAAVPDRGREQDPAKETIDSLMVVRKILDGAATVEEAAAIIQEFNINWGSGPALHYLVADASGRSVLIEFSKDEILILENQDPWQAATNFLVSEARGEPAAQCWRYGLITERLENSLGELSGEEAMALLEAVAQPNTQWSVVYGSSAGEVRIAMGRDYSEIHRFPFIPGQ